MNVNQNLNVKRLVERKLQSEINVFDNRTAQDFFEAHAKNTPDQIALVTDNETLTYFELNQRANKFAHYLRDLGAASETLVAIAMDRSIEFIISVLGILKAGCAYVPLDYTHPKERIDSLMEDTEATFLITTSQLKQKLNSNHSQMILIDDAWKHINHYPEENLGAISQSNHLAYIIYTSGSTGKPKGAQIEHRSLVNYAKWFAHYSECKSKDIIDFSSNFIFDLTISSYLVALMLGMQVVICSDDVKRDLRKYLQFLEKHKINVTKMTPSFFKILLQQAMNTTVDLSHLHKIILGGENLPTADCENWLKLYPHQQLFNEYGPTETTVAVLDFAVTINNVRQLPKHVPIGKAREKYDIHCLILDKAGNIAPPGNTGELYIGGINVCRGYLKSQEMTDKKFVYDQAGNRFYKTGDLCRYLSDGTIEYIGRIDDQIKIRGFRIELNEIEHCLLSHPQIKNAVIIARENQINDKQLIAYFILKNCNDKLETQTLRHYLQKHLPDYMIPHAFIVMEQFPLTANGKLDKKSLPQPEMIFKKSDQLPENELQKKIADIWSEVLGINDIGIHENFFELGGHSLSVARVISRIEKKLGKIISLKDFYSSPTISLLSNLFSSEPIYSEHEIMLSHDHENTIALSDFQFMFWISHIFEPKVKKLNIVARRRLAGNLDVKALNFAFEALLKKHKILSHRISTFFPSQHYQPHLKFNLIETDLRRFPSPEREKILTESLNQLIAGCHWKKNVPLLFAKLFHLDENIDELQICMPHIVSDDGSEELIFNELSAFYLAYQKEQSLDDLTLAAQYQHYVLQERKNLATLEKDILFWEDYLKDTALFQFPLSVIEKNCKVYSTYLDVPEKSLQNIQRISALNQISYVDLLCASIVISLKKHFVMPNQAKQKILMNIIKSTREQKIYETMLGCFLRLDPIKVDLSQEMDLISLAKHIRTTMLDIADYQHCGSMVKLACMTKQYWQNKKMINFLFNIIAKSYAKLFPKLKLHPKVLMMYPRLRALRTPRQFLININLFNNFLALPLQKHSNLFGFDTVNLNIHRFDLSTIDNVLDICFLRDDARDKTYLVLSANLKPSLREQLGKVIIENMSVEV